MISAARNSTARFYAGLYWIGIITTVACFALVLAGNTNPIYPLEHSRFPLSWIAGGAAILSFLAAEFCHTGASLGREAEEENSELVAPEWEAIEA